MTVRKETDREHARRIMRLIREHRSATYWDALVEDIIFQALRTARARERAHVLQIVYQGEKLRAHIEGLRHDLRDWPGEGSRASMKP